MKIVYTSRDTTLDQLEPGECFMYEGKTYMRILVEGNEHINAVCLEDGTADSWMKSVDVVRVDAELRVMNEV